MDASIIPILMQRLERLERSNRRLKALAACVLVGLAAVLLMGQARPALQTIEAQEFIVKDANGNIRARLGNYAAGASLNLYQESGRASLVASGTRGQGAHLSLADATGKIKGLFLLSQEAVGVYLSPVDATGPPRSPRVVLEALAQGSGGFAVYDRAGQMRALMGAIADDGNAIAVVQDKEGKAAWKAP